MIIHSLIACAVFGALGMACSGSGGADVVVGASPTEPDGTLTLRWTIAGTTDPAACDDNNVDQIDISITDPNNGDEIAGFQQDCRAFQTDIPLAPGDYAAAARMVDGSGHALTTDVQVAPFTLVGNDQLVQDIDFPDSSFF
jgi:hypothetical protein